MKNRKEGNAGGLSRLSPYGSRKLRPTSGYGKAWLNAIVYDKRNLGFIGGGAVGGALLGGLAGAGKGALIGSAIGAGAGTAGAAATGDKEISLPAEARLTFYLLRSVTVRVKG